MGKPVSWKLEDGSYCIDLRSWMCPYPKYMIDPIFEKLPAGSGQVTLLVDCPSASTDVPDVARKKGYTVKDVSQINDGEWQIVIEY
ncbi:sulfurtransferase TusA family protein [Chloroflexota bacterium]